MRGLSFATILSGIVVVLLLISVGMMGFVTYKLGSADPAETVADFWKGKKFLLLTPTVMNVLSMVLVGVLIMT